MKIDLTDDAVLETTSVYICRSWKVSLCRRRSSPPAKSEKLDSAGSTFSTRVIADGTRRFDKIGQPAITGPLYARSAKTFRPAREGSRQSAGALPLGDAVSYDPTSSKRCMPRIGCSIANDPISPRPGATASICLARTPSGFSATAPSVPPGVVDIDRAAAMR